MGAYAATCAYFLIISFVPFIMIFIALSRRADSDSTAFMNAIINIVPSGLKTYVLSIISEVYIKPLSILPLSLVIIVWSASKALHALTNGLNVINKVEETRGWFITRFRSMLIVFLAILSLIVLMRLSVYGRETMAFLEEHIPYFRIVSDVVYNFRGLFSYGALLFIFLCVYKFLPNCHLTFRSQLPGALVVTTVWMFFSYLMTVYYNHSRSFLDMYGSLTGIILAMVWMYFCMYFLLVGAEMNRVILEDPEHNIINSAVDDLMEASIKKQEKVSEQIAREEEEVRIRTGATQEMPLIGDDELGFEWDDVKYADEEPKDDFENDNEEAVQRIIEEAPSKASSAGTGDTTDFERERLRRYIEGPADGGTGDIWADG